MKLSDVGTGTTALSDAELYASLTSALPVSVPSCSAQILVLPNNADGSVLVSKLSSATPVCGAQMPFNCATTNGPCLTSDQVNIVKAWINAGGG